MPQIARSNPAPQAHRYFFALMPDSITAHRIHAFAEGTLGRGNLHPAERLHVTLAITRDFPAPQPALIRAMGAAADEVAVAPFPLTLDQLSGGSHTMALRPAHSIRPLRILQAEIAQAMARAGIGMRPSFQFSPHLTLTYRGGEVLSRPVENFGWPVREFVLIESLVGLGHYDVHGRWFLQEPSPRQGILFPD